MQSNMNCYMQGNIRVCHVLIRYYESRLYIINCQVQNHHCYTLVRTPRGGGGGALDFQMVGVCRWARLGG